MRIFNLYPPFKNSTTRTAIMINYSLLQEDLLLHLDTTVDTIDIIDQNMQFIGLEKVYDCQIIQHSEEL